MDPKSIAGSLLTKVLYGPDHVYSGRTIAEREEMVKSINRQDLVDFHEMWIRPDNAEIYVVGDTTLDEITAQLNAAFGDWKNPERPKGRKNITDAEYAKKSRIILVDRPAAGQ